MTNEMPIPVMEVIETAKEATLTIRLPEAIWQELDREATASNRLLESVVADIIQLGLRRKGGCAAHARGAGLGMVIGHNDRISWG